MGIFKLLLGLVKTPVVQRAALAAENLALRHQRRRVVHFNVTAKPSAERAAQQIFEAFPWAEAPRFVVRCRRVA